MARYNSGFVYDPSTSTGTFYGAQDPSTTSFNSNIAVFQSDYRKNQITWNSVEIDLTISGGSHEATHWKIVKSPSGVPDHPDYAKYVIGDAVGTDNKVPSSASAYNGFYLDTENKYPAGTEVTYSFWVYNGVDWFFCGSADSIVVENVNNTTLKLMQLLPSIWITGSYSIGGMASYPDSVDTVTGETTDLYRYLYNFGFYYDKLHQQVENVYNSSNYRKFPSRYLGSALSSLGFDYEPTLGIKYAKSLYRFGNMINSLKGSNLGVNLYIRALTHLTNTVDIGTNLMLSSGVSSFEGSVGTWGGNTTSFTITKTQVTSTKGSPSSALITVSTDHGFNVNDRVTVSGVSANGDVYNGIWVIDDVPSTTSFTYGVSSNTISEVTGTLGTVTHSIIFAKKYSGSGSDLTTADRPTLKLSDTSNMLRDWYGQVTMSAATATMTSYYTTETFRKITQSVPVTPGNEYYFSGYIRRSTGNAAGTTSTAGIQAAIQWFDFQGNFVGSTNYGTKVITTAAGTWYSFESSLYNDQIVAPPTAAYAGIQLYISGATVADKFYLDSFQFTLFPDNHNISYGMGLPIFQEARTATLQIDAVRTNLIRNPSFEVDVSSWGYLNGRLTRDTSDKYIGSSSCLFIANSTDGAVHSDWMVLESDTWYTFSAYVKGPATKTAKVGLEFTFPTSAADQNKILTDAYSKYLDPTTNIAYSTAVTINSTTWTRITYTVKSPQYVADNGLPIAKAIISFPATTSSESYWVDACLLEKGKTAKTFFSGAGGDTLTDPLTQNAVATADCLWEKRVRTNWVDQPVFSTLTTGSAAPRWSNATGGTNTVSTDYYKFGTKSLKVVITTTGAYANTYTTIKYPSKKTLNTGYTGTDLFYGGEPVTASAYIYSSTAGYYNIILSDNSGTSTYGTLGSISNIYRGSGPSLTLTSVNQNYGQYVPANTWTRISQTFTLPRNTSTSTVGCRLGIGGPVGTMYVDGVQLELGRTPTPFIDPTAASSIGNPNPKDTAYTIYSSEDYLNNSGRSYYWPRRESKFVRLGLAISDYLPMDMKKKFIYGAPQPAEWPEVDSSLVPNSSFENGTEGWTTDASTTTVITHTGLGSLFVDSLSSKNKMCGAFSPSWLIVDGSTTATSIGVTSPWTPIPDPNYQHYLSVAIKTGVTNSATGGTYYNRSKGTYVVTATWYAADKTTVLGTSTLNTLTLTGGNTDGSGNTYGVYGNRWNIADGYVTPPLNTSYAKISIVFTPTTPSATNEFFVDRVILKQV